MTTNETVLILDFGSQYTQLIARRIRESNVFSIIKPFNFTITEIEKLAPAGIILSGGPMSIYDENSPKIDNKIFEMGIPILGICYGLQLISYYFGGKVEPAENREYGKAVLQITNLESKIFKNVRNQSVVWMSHGDYVTELPINFTVTSKTENSPVCSIENEERRIYGVQFHPEVAHSLDGEKIIQNFLFDVCKLSGNWTSQNFIAESIIKIKETVADNKVLLALSGGVDSSVAAILMHKAIGENLICVHVDNGLMRKDESSQIVKMFEEQYNLHLIHSDATDEFLSQLEEIEDPEQKRKIIGKTFIDVFERESKKYDAKYLVQGTLYPDVIESIPVQGASVTIKTHHNVGGLPARMNLKLIEPFKELFKDEVRQIGRDLGLPESFIARHPFPGPGLAVRILGKITRERLTILREADEIYIEELKTHNIYNEIWQAFAVLLPIKTVGVMGDARTYENVIALRAVTSTDGMTADWYPLDYGIMEKISNKIIRNVKGVNRVVYDISSKPPATIEWE